MSINDRIFKADPDGTPTSGGAGLPRCLYGRSEVAENGRQPGNEVYCRAGSQAPKSALPALNINCGVKKIVLDNARPKTRDTTK